MSHLSIADFGRLVVTVDFFVRRLPSVAVLCFFAFTILPSKVVNAQATSPRPTNILFIVTDDGRDELYDLTLDPEESYNLIDSDDPAVVAIHQALNEKLIGKMKLLGDPLAASIKRQPNIVFILADDLGWSDLGCYGHPWHRTPNLDRLADSGMMFTQAYAPAPICSASRASILTGKTTARLGLEFVVKNEVGPQRLDFEPILKTPPLTNHLPLSEITVAERLAGSGYQTAFFGKWHVSEHHNNRYLAWHPKFGPSRQGFQIAEEDFGDHPYAWNPRDRPDDLPTGEYPDDTMVNRVTKFIRGDHAKPYFAFASSFYVHTPVKNRARWLVKRYEALIPKDSPRRQARLEYAAFLETFDHHVGQILDAIEDSADADNTMVVFTSDNGGHPEFTASSPLRGSKWNLYEGGIRVPLIVRLPGVVARSSRCDVPVIGYDLPATLVDFASEDPVTTDGSSLRRLLVGESEQELDRPLVWHFPYYHPETEFLNALQTIGVDDFGVSQTRPQSAIRIGNWKALTFAETDRLELYDLSTDVSEQNDLSEACPEKAAEMRRTLEAELTRMKARHAVATHSVD